MAELLMDGIEKKYDSGNFAVENFNLQIEDNEFVVFVGPSGCGKSTVLRMIAGLEKATAGNIYIDGKTLDKKMATNGDIAMVFQNYALYPHMSVYDNIAYSMKIKRTPKKEIKKNVNRVVKTLGLEAVLDRKPGQLSGGQKQRVAIGKALIRTPKVFLMDEPLSNLDAKLRTQMRMEIKKLYEHSDATFVYVTHDQTEAMTLGTKIVVLNNGKIQQIAAPGELYNNPANLFVAQFIGTPQMNVWKAKVVQQKRNVVLVIAGLGSYKLSEKNAELLRKRGYFDKEIYVGIRPEDIFLQVRGMDDNMFQSGLKARLRVYEPDGAVSYLHLESSEQEKHGEKVENTSNNVTIRIEGSGDFIEDLEYHFGFDESKIHFFDIKTENVII